MGEKFHTYGRDGGDDLTELELVEDGGLPCSVEADHEDAHLLLSEEALEELGEGETHGDDREREKEGRKEGRAKNSAGSGAMAGAAERKKGKGGGQKCEF